MRARAQRNLREAGRRRTDNPPTMPVESTVVTVPEWTALASRDALARGLSDLASLLEALGRMTAALRSAPWNRDARDLGDGPSPPDPHGR
jgi:hypothetical protein